MKKLRLRHGTLNGDLPNTVRKIPGYSIAGEETRISAWLKKRDADCMKNVKIIPIKKLK